MADLGAIAKDTLDTGGWWQTPCPPQLFRKLSLDATEMVWGGRDNTQGNPAQPSLVMNARGVFRFRWAFTAGPHTVSVNVMQAVNLSPRPSLTVKANSDVGINADVTSIATASATWVTLSASINASVAGATFVELRANYDGQYVPCYWDHVVTT